MIKLTNLTQAQSLNQIKKAENPNLAVRANLLNTNIADTVKFSKLNNVIEFKQFGKNLGVVSFGGLKNPLDSQKPALQMRVTGVTGHQASSDPSVRSKDTNINDLAESHWKDGQELDFSICKGMQGKPMIKLTDPTFGEIGRVPDEIAKIILPAIKSNPNSFRAELSNIIAGTTKGAETIGLRVNLLYTGENKEEESKVKECFNKVLNSSECSEKVLMYQPKTSPEEVLKLILDYETKINGPEAAKQMDSTINNIVKEIKNPVNKRILLVGHCKPDGDTLGCALGLKNAIGLMDSSKKVDCAIDDKVPGLFRSKLPGIDGEIKRPYSPESLKKLQTQIKTLEKRPQDIIVKDQIKALKAEVQLMNDSSNFLEPNEQYDMVVMLDIPTPSRFSDKFKNYLENANKVIYIDHHPHRINEWKKEADNIGFDMDKVHENKLAWIADTVPAATQLVAIIADKLLPGLSSKKLTSQKNGDISENPNDIKKVNAMVASLAVGMSTDTGAYTRTANLLPEHMLMNVQDRPNFKPEGLTKWLIDLTKGIDKKWLREEISYDITDQKSVDIGSSARDIMLKSAVDGKKINADLSLGTISVSYEKMYQVWQAAREIEPSTTMLDVQNAYKYSEALGVLKSDPAKSGSTKEKSNKLTDPAKENYIGKYDSDRVAVLIMQDKKAGELDEKMNTAELNGLRISIRSAEGSIHAELLCSLFGGGGHGGAAGGRVDLPGVTTDTKLGVEIDGKSEKDASVIHKALCRNYEAMHGENNSSSAKSVKIVEDESGKNCAELIEDITTEIRANQKQETPEKTNKKRANVREFDQKIERPILKSRNISFSGLVSNIFSKKVV